MDFSYEKMHFPPQYVTQTVEVESPATLKHLSKARQRNELLSEKLSGQNERCRQLEEQIRKSDEHSCNLQHKVTKSDCCLKHAGMQTVSWRF